MLEALIQKKLWRFTLNFKLRLENEILVLWGPSGAGKTTILQCLAGLAKPSSGFIKLNKQVFYSSKEKIHLSPQIRNVGYLFQDYALFPHMTVRENVMYGIKSKRLNKPFIDPVELLNSFGAGHLINRYPRQLSGGEKQRVALARALAVQPKLLLLDEPFSALDKATKESLRQEVKKLHRQWQIPFILVTHDEDDVNYLGDRFISLDKGLSSEKMGKVPSLNLLFYNSNS